MKKHKYQYQILQVIPDRVTGEFVNIGIVFYSQENKYLRWSFLEEFHRVVNFFPEFKWNFLPQRIEGLDRMLRQINTSFNESEVSKMPESVINITSAFMAPNDSTFIFSRMENGIAPDLDNMFNYLKVRLIPRNHSVLTHLENQHILWISTVRESGNTYTFHHACLGLAQTISPPLKDYPSTGATNEEEKSFSEIA